MTFHVVLKDGTEFDRDSPSKAEMKAWLEECGYNRKEQPNRVKAWWNKAEEISPAWCGL